MLHRVQWQQPLGGRGQLSANSIKMFARTHAASCCRPPTCAASWLRFSTPPVAGDGAGSGNGAEETRSAHSGDLQQHGNGERRDAALEFTVRVAA